MKSVLNLIVLLYFHSCSAGIFDVFKPLNEVKIPNLLNNLNIPKDFDILNVTAFKCFDVTKSFDDKPWNPIDCLTKLDCIDDIFNRFMIRFNKKYTKEELPMRRANILRAIETIVKCIIDSLIPENDIKYTLGLTSIADLNSTEYSKLSKTYIKPLTVDSSNRQKRAASSDPCQPKTNSTLPQSFDWRNINSKNYVTSVKDQRDCGDCWSFATTATIESQYLIKTNQSAPQTSTDQAEQDLLNCAPSNGCNGGYVGDAMQFVINNGQAKDNAAPYTARQAACNHYPLNGGMVISAYCRKGGTTTYTRTWPNGTVERWSVTEDNPDPKIQRDLCENGPIVMQMNANEISSSFQYYKSGIYGTSTCPKDINHAITLVGYGTESGTDYWIIKNSWGSGWGENGYLRMKRGQNMCGVNGMYFYPIMTNTAPFNKAS